MAGRVGWRGFGMVALLLGLALAGPRTAAGQELADFDYENLSFRGVGLETGYLWPSRVEPTQTVGVRMDMGYLGPGLRILPNLGYWSAPFRNKEVSELEERVAELVVRQTGEPAPEVDLGVIDWTDLRVGLDAQVVWRVPGDLLTFAGAGAAVHILNGDGAAVNGTFVEDLLDSVTAGFNLHGGVEYPLGDRIRAYGLGRYELLGDLQYLQLGTGLQFMIGGSAPGETGTP